MAGPEPSTERLVEERSCDVAIVGAGAAGLATAIFARRLNSSRSILLLDSSARPGAKILVSGGSRCNVTNASVSERDFNGGKPAIVRRILKAFPPSDVVAWFASLGVPLHEEPHGKLFPDSNRSRDVLNALLAEARACGVELRASTRVEDVVRGPRLTIKASNGVVHADAVVMATGGLSLPKTGSDGHGLVVAERLGHTIVSTTPALVPLTLGDTASVHRDLTGVSQDVELALWVDGAIGKRLRGALLWTHFGMSGPVALDMSRHWLRARLDGTDARLTINFARGNTFDVVDAGMISLGATRSHASLHTALAEMLPASVATAILQHLDLDPGALLAHLTRDARRKLSHALTQWPVTITGSRGYNFAEATAGGVALDEIDPATMESRRCRDLYLVGEMLDVDGRIGGFNFQWAWASARVAARALARRA